MGNILYTQSEVGMMSKLGGGTSGYFGHIRHRGSAVKNNGEASGSVHIMQLFETMVDVVSQGSVRRGRFSPYLPVEHEDISEFLDELVQDHRDQSNLKKIESLEQKLINSLDENSYSELIKLKSQLNRE